MSVLVTFSLTNGGTAISDVIDHGSFSNGAGTTAQEIFIRHDGDNSITSCGFFIQAASDDYEGDFTANTDLNEVLAWGNDSTSSGFGGFQFNLNATGAGGDAFTGFYPTWSWSSYSDKAPTDSGSNIVGNVCRTGTGDSATNAINVVTNMGCTSNGTIQAGSAPNVRFKCRFYAPQSEDTTGVRHITQSMTYTYTS